MLGSDPAKMPLTSYTVGIDTPEVLVKKVKEAGDCRIIKVKLGRGSEKAKLINTTCSGYQCSPICRRYQPGLDQSAAKFGYDALAAGTGCFADRATHAEN